MHARSQRSEQRLVLCGGAAVLGFLANLCHVTVFSDVLLLPGGPGYLVAALAGGPVWGAVAAVVATAPSLLWSHHPLMVLLAAAEAACVALLNRKRIAPVAAELLYWGLLGGPASAYLYFVHLHYPSPVRWLILMAQPLIQILAAIAAAQLVSLPERRSLRSHLRHRFLLIALVPLVVLGVADLLIQARRIERQSNDTMRQMASALREDSDSFVRRHQLALEALAGAIRLNDRYDPGWLSRWLAQAHSVYPDFQLMFVADAQGQLLGSHPARNPDGEPVAPLLGRIADRPYFRATAEMRSPRVSNVFWGRYTQEPVIAMTAPLIDKRGALRGVITGSLRLSSFRFRHSDAGRRFSLTVLDATDQVVSSDGGRYRPLQSLESSPLVAAAARHTASNSFLFDEPDPHGLNQRLLVAQQRSALTGWRFFVEQPQSAIAAQMQGNALLTMMWFLVALGLSLGVSGPLASTVTFPLERLARRMAHFAETREPVTPLPMAARIPSEVAEIVRSFERMASQIFESQAQLREVLGDLDRKVTERTAELDAARRRAEDASLAKSQFLANMSHEIRTPMNGVLGMLAVLDRAGLAPHQVRDLEVAESSARGLLSVLNDVLDFSMIESGKLHIESVPFSPRQCVDEAGAVFRSLARQKGLQLRVEAAADVPERVSGDPYRLRQVLVNLLSNALKFTESGSIELRVEALQQPAALRFEVRDTGIGMSAEQLPVIFEAFRQADGSIARKYGGTGLGLSISSHLVRLMGGDLSVTSSPGAGSAFRFTLPYTPAAPDCGPNPAVQVSLPPLHILLAEDNAINQLVTTRLLRKHGHTIELAVNGVEAVQKSARTCFDVILMDMQMPELDGLEAARQIRVREKAGEHRIPIVALTANVMKGDPERCIEAGMDGYVAKPVQLPALLSEIGRILPAVR